MQQPKEAKEHKDKLDDDVNSTVITNISQSTVQDQSPPDTSSHKPPPGENAKISLRHRLKHFTFAWFLSTMSTGGLSIALAETPHQFPGTVLLPNPLPITHLTKIHDRPLHHRPNSPILRHRPLHALLHTHGRARSAPPPALPQSTNAPA
jgi:hypothetical protein